MAAAVSSQGLACRCAPASASSNSSRAESAAAQLKGNHGKSLTVGFTAKSVKMTAFNRPKSHKAAPTVRAHVLKPEMDNLSGVVTDKAVPEGHKGLHGFLYGEGDAGIHDGPRAKEFAPTAGEDDGSSIQEFEGYVSARGNWRFSGVYAVYSSDGKLQYVGYSRNVLLSLKAHRDRVGAQKCGSVKVQAFTSTSIVSRAGLEEERQRWLEREKQVPPGNSSEVGLWERGSGAVQAMTEEERSEYEEKKLKLRKAMGENLHDDVKGEDEGTRLRRLKLLAAVEGDDWSSVIHGQTEEAVLEKLVVPDLDDDEEEVGIPIESPFVSSEVPIVSPFDERKKSGLYSADVYSMSKDNVDLVLNEVRPYLISDGGNVEVVSVDDGVVSLRLQGACGTCPSSTTTMKMGIERVLTEKFGAALKSVVQVGQAEIGATVTGVNEHLDVLRPAIHNYGGFVEVVSVDSSKGKTVIKYKGPAPIGTGIQAAIKDKFPDIKEVVFVDPQ